MSFFIMYKHVAYVDGGKTEEWCLPFLTWSTFYVIKYFEDYYSVNKTELNKFCSLFFGISFGVCFMMKQTNAVVIFVLVFFSYINLLINKQYKNLVINIAFCFLGFGIVVLPFLIYFYINNAINYYLFANFIFQTSYAKGMRNGFNVNLLNELTYYYPVYLNIITVFMLIKTNKLLFALSIFYSLLFGYCFMLLTYHGVYYEIIFFPLFPVFVNEVKYFFTKENHIKKYILFLLPFILIFSNRFLKSTSFFKSFIPAVVYIDKEFKDIISYCHSDSIVTYTAGHDKYVLELVLLYRNNKYPLYKYFFNHMMFSNLNKNIRKEIHDEFYSGKSEYVVIEKGKQYNQEIPNDILDIFEKKYMVEKENKKFKLYKRVEAYNE